MADLVALSRIQVGFREYQPGDTLPAVSPELEAEWIASGAALRRPEGYEPKTWTTAKRAAAEPGLPGIAVGGEATGEDLVGKIPQTPQRRRGPWKP